MSSKCVADTRVPASSCVLFQLETGADPALGGSRKSANSGRRCEGAVDFPPRRSRFESKARLFVSQRGGLVLPELLRDRCATMAGGETPRMHLRAVKQNPQIHPYPFQYICIPFTRFAPFSSRRRFAEFYVNSKRVEASSLDRVRLDATYPIPSDSVGFELGLHARSQAYNFISPFFFYFFLFFFIFFMNERSLGDEIARDKELLKRNFLV